MKKVLLITRPIAPPWDEGSKNFAYYLAKNLDGFELGILVNDRLSDLPGNVGQIPVYSSNKLDFIQKFNLFKVRNFINDFDIMHFMLTPNKLNSFAFKTFLKSKKAKTIQTVATLREDLYSDADFKKILFTDLIITYSDYAKNKLNEIGFSNVECIYPGIDLDVFKPTNKEDSIRKEYSASKDNFLIMYPGEYTRLGFTDYLFDFAIKYNEELRKRNIIIIFPARAKTREDIKKRDELKKLSIPKNIADIVHFPDMYKSDSQNQVDFATKRFSAMDLIIFPVLDMKGKFDIPLAIIEAMACEKSVILSNLPILAELNNGQNSVIIEKGNIKQLFEAVLDLYDHPEKRMAIGKAARKFVEERFDIRKIAEKYKEIYKKL